MHLFEELLVDLKDANDDVFPIFEVMSALVDRIVESIRVHVEGFLNPKRLVLAQSVSGETQVINLIPQSGPLAFFNFLDAFEARVLFLRSLC